MNKIFLLIFFGCSLFACRQNSSQVSDADKLIDAHEETQLSLKNGEKWQADAQTNENVAYLKLIADAFSKNQRPSVEEYHALSFDLTSGINKMIKECKMTGREHEALHKWLEPLIKMNAGLKNESDTLQARKDFIILNDHLNVYNKYFE